MKIILNFWILIFILNAKFNIANQENKNYKGNNENDSEEKFILPFSTIQMKNEKILISIENDRKNLFYLFSINNIGVDAIVKFSKDRYGLEKCEYEIECFKYNIIVNFEKVYKSMQGENIPIRVGMELKVFDNNKSFTDMNDQEEKFHQNGLDVESSHEKYLLNKKYIQENIEMSKKFCTNNFMKIFNLNYEIPSLIKGMKNSYNNFFNPKENNTVKINNLRGILY